jgi:hypothetical protein
MASILRLEGFTRFGNPDGAGTLLTRLERADRRVRVLGASWWATTLAEHRERCTPSLAAKPAGSV